MCFRLASVKGTQFILYMRILLSGYFFVSDIRSVRIFIDNVFLGPKFVYAVWELYPFPPFCPCCMGNPRQGVPDCCPYTIGAACRTGKRRQEGDRSVSPPASLPFPCMYRRLPAVSDAVQSLFYIVYYIVGVFYPYRQAYKVRSDSGLAQLLFRKLPVRMAGRVKHACACISHVRYYTYHFQAVHELYGFIAASFQSESYYPARAVRQIFLSQPVIFVAFQPAIVYPCHAAVLLQKFGNFLSVCTMLFHAQVQCFQSEIQQKRVHGALYRPEVAHQLRGGLCHISHFAEGFGVDKAVVAFVGLAQSGELVGMCVPVEIPAVYYGPANGRGMSVHVFGGGVRYYVCTPFKRAAVYGGGKRVVNYKGHAVFVCHAGEPLYVEYVYPGVGDSFAEYAFRVGAESGFNFVVIPIGVDKGALYAKFLHGYPEQVERAAINCVGCNKMITCLAYVEYCVKIGGLPG